MKKYILSLAFLAVLTSTYAQKSEIAAAKQSYAQFELGLSMKYDMAKQLENLNAAKSSTDKAIANEKTKDNAELWAYRSLILSAISATDTLNKVNSEEAFKSALESIKKAKEVDTKKEFDKTIASAENNLAITMQNRGLSEFNNKNYAKAYESFKYIATVMPQDSTFNMYTAIAATNAQMYDEAINFYQKTIAINASNPNLYHELGRIYLIKQDTASALKTFEEGGVKHPTNINLVFDELNIYLNKGMAGQKIAKIENAIAKDPTNKVLRFVSGIAYKANNEMSKAEEAYKKAIEIDPNYQEAYYNLAVLYIDKGNAFINQANKLPNTKAGQTKYEELKKSFEAELANAIPYLEKAMELNPKDATVLSTLREIYVKLNKLDKAAAIKKLIDQM